MSRNYEIDFIASKDGETMFIQLSLSIMSDDVLSRESRPSHYLKANGLKYILTLDEIEMSGDYYKHMNVFDFIEKINKK